ncbi:MAG: transporter [Candidatus Hydrogenedentota bacterium]
MKRFVIFLSSIFVLPITILADPWVLPKGQSYALFYFSIATVDKYFDDNSDDIRLAGDLNILKVAANYSVGIRDHLGIRLEIPYSRWEREFPGNTDVNSGIGDSEIDLKYTLVKRDLYAVSLLCGIKIPGSYEENKINSPGDGSIDVPVGVSFGGVYQQYFYDIDFIYRFRSQEPRDEVEINIDGGIRPSENFLLKLHYTKVDSFGGKGVSDANFRYEELEEDFDRGGITIDFIPGNKWDFFVDYTWTIDGRNTPELDLFTSGFGVSF